MASGGGDGISSISGGTLEKARKELGEVPEKRAEVIQQLREKIEQWEQNPEEGGVTFSRKDDKFLLRFLRARKFNTDRALQLYVNYHKYRQKYAHVLNDYSPKTVEHVLKSGTIGVLDTRARNGSKVICIFPGRWDYEHLPFADNFKTLMLVLDKPIEDEENQVHGFTIFNNMEGASFFAVTSLARTEHVQKGLLIELIQEAFPARFKGMHLIMQPWYVSIVLTIVRPFMKQKLRERINLHGADFESLHEHIDPENLPRDFGGQQAPLALHSAMKLFRQELQS